MRVPHLLLAAVAAAVVAAPGFAQPSSEPSATLRKLFFQRDYESALIEAAKHPADASRVEQNAWRVLNLARGGREDEAVTAARELNAARPADGWSWFALGAALHYKGGNQPEAIAAAEKALAMMPDNADAIWLRATTLNGDPKRREEAIAFVDSQRARVKNPAELLTAKGYALYVLSSNGDARDEAKLEAAFDVFAEARRLDPANVTALFLPGTYLDGLRRSDEAWPLLKKAVAAAPNSAPVRQAYWNALKGSKTLTAEQKQQDVVADMNVFLEKNSNRPGALRIAAFAARDLKLLDRQKELEDKILAQFNDSSEAEWVLTYRIRALDNPEGSKTPQYRQLLRAYIARSKHYHQGLLGEMYRELFFLVVNDETPDQSELVRLADGMLKYETSNIHLTHVQSAIMLADKKVLLDKAEQIARDSMAALRKRVESTRSFYKDDKEFEDRLKSAPAIGHDALGWVLFTKGQFDEAEKELLKAHELSPANRDNLYHLGRFYETRGAMTKAEEFYVKGLGVSSPGTNPSQAALKALYEKREGKAEGFDTYLASLTEADRVRRREKILADRAAAPEAAPAFALKALDGKPVTLASLKGKIVVINFWGIWCGWCVMEMPDLQKLYDKYKADPNVAIVTIDNDRNPDDVPPWMKEKGYTFPVLIDDGYVTKVGITAFPTTWFLDGDGRRAFVKVGWSEKLLEEFSWRIEALRATTTSATRRDE